MQAPGPQITARRLNQLESQSRVRRKNYDHFDYLDAACRAALREQEKWPGKAALLKCGARECGHH